VLFGTVTGRIVATIADRIGDPDVNPDVVPVYGKVRFTPSVDAAISSTEGAIILPTPIEADLDEQGYISINGVRGASLIATDSPDLNPSGFTYTVSFIDLKFDKFPLAYKSFSMALPAGTTVDLSTVTPVKTSNGATIIRGAQGDPGPSAYEAWLSLGNTGTVYDFIVSLKGEPGGGGYVKPTDGIPASDLAAGVRTSLGKADTALQTAPVASVAGRTGAVTLTKADVSLGNVDNTSDAAKPVSTASASLVRSLSQAGTPRSTSVVVIGDSIDQGGDSDGARPYWSGSVWSRLAATSKGAFQLTHNVAIGGQTTGQMLARFTADVVPYAPGVVVIGGGRNDLNGGVASATTRANLAAMVALARANGIVPVLHTLAPTDSAGAGAYASVQANRTGTIAHNAWLADWALARGVAVVDLWAIWADSATGGYKTGYSDDGTHPNGVAVSAAIAALIANGLPEFLNADPRLATSNTDSLNLFVNGLAATDSNNDGTPDGWYFPDATAVTTSAAAYGKQITVTAGTGTQKTAYGPSTTAYLTGDVLAFSGRITTTGSAKPTISLQNQDYQSIATPIANLGVSLTDATWYMEYTAEASVTQVFPVILADGAGTVTASQVTLRNLSAERRSRIGVDKAIASGVKVTAVAGRTGAVTLTKADVGLTNVDNTADTAKPVSTAQATAIAAKVDTTAAAIGQVYFRDVGGAAGGITAASGAATAGSLVQRQSDGSIFVGTPTVAGNAATKAYADTKAPIASPTFTGTVSGITAAMTGSVANDGAILRVKQITQSAYTALATKDANTLYVIVG
jgi:hypothetical protein